MKLKIKLLIMLNILQLLNLNTLTAEKFATRLKQADLVNETNFDDKPISFNRKIISSKIKYLEVQKKLNSLTTKDYNFFSD